MDDARSYEKRTEASRTLAAPVHEVFDYIDDHPQFYSHVTRLARLMGGQMDLRMDDDHGRQVGSRIRLSGRFLGRQLSLEEVVTWRSPPGSKSSRTVGTPKFLVVGPYHYHVTVEPAGQGARLSIAIDYSPPDRSGWLRQRLSNAYMKVCAKEMVSSASKHVAKRRHH